MPGIAGLVDNMPDAEFQRRFGGVGASAYNNVIEDITRRVLALASVQVKPVVQERCNHEPHRFAHVGAYTARMPSHLTPRACSPSSPLPLSAPRRSRAELR